MKFSSILGETDRQRMARIREEVKNPNNKAKKILDYISQNPGKGYKEIMTALELPEGTISSTPHRFKMTGKLKARKQDGLQRFYPNSYQFVDEVKEVHVPQPVKTPKTTSNDQKMAAIVEDLAKDYTWNTGVDSAPLREFIEYLKGGEK